MRVLLVCGDPILRESIAGALAGLGHEAIVFTGEEAALRLFEKELCQFVIFDWTRPGPEGLDFCREIRGMSNGGDSYLVVLTEWTKPSDLALVADSGADDYFIKPVDPELFKLTLRMTGRHVKNLGLRNHTDVKFVEACQQIEKNQNVLTTILNSLRIGTIMIDGFGRVMFISKSAMRLSDKQAGQVQGLHWEKLFDMGTEDRNNVKLMLSLHESKRTKATVTIESARGHRYRVEVEVHDDPDDASRRILFFYDVSDVYDLRRLLGEKARFHDLVGRTEAMLQVYRQIEDVAKVDWTVLVEGDTGTGKELVARAIHSLSHRKEKPFVAVNCAGLTDSLLASQLFGHKRGAFTGAVNDYVGVFEAASGSTIFLDEVGDMSASVQTSLLRVLEEREITRLGETVPRKIDVRVIAATHKDLTEETRNGNFREDLLYRIRVARIHLPPLRERREDIPLLAALYLGQARSVTGKDAGEFSNGAMAMLLEYPWPGNVRELKSAVEFAVIHCKAAIIQDNDLPPEIQDCGKPAFPPHSNNGSEVNRQRFVAALRQAGGNRTEAARILGISRATFYRHFANFNHAHEDGG